MNKKEFYQSKIDACNEALTKFAGNVIKNPAHTMEWGGVAFTIAAIHKVYSELLSMLNNGMPDSDVKKYATERAFFCAQHSESSSSATANIMNREICSVWAQVARQS